MSKKTITILFLILAVAVIVANAVIRRLHFNQGIMIFIEIMALVIMGFILLVWIFLVYSTIIMRRKNEFILNLEYPVDISNSPIISIIVPARNEERNIRRCLVRQCHINPMIDD